jgi:hypothetical protein
MDVDNQEIKLVHEKMGYGRKLFTRLREILMIDSEIVPLSSVLQTESDDEVFKMEQELEAFKNELYKNRIWKH